MKKYIAAGLSALGFSSSAMAADAVCTIPTAYVSRASALCEELRLRLNIRSSEWSTDVCASEFLRIGLIVNERKSVEAATRQTVNQDVNDAIDAFRTAWPPLLAADCGDGILDTEFDEQCDDGNLEDGDGCDQDCQDE